MSLRALQRRVKRLETGSKPKRSPFTIWFDSFDTRGEQQELPGIEIGAFEPDDIIVVVAALRAWEDGGVWAVAYAR